MATERRLIGMKAVCTYVNRSEPTVLGWIRDMDFPARKVGNIWEADAKDIDRWRKDRTDSTVANPPKLPKREKTETRI